MMVGVEQKSEVDPGGSQIGHTCDLHLHDNAFIFLEIFSEALHAIILPQGNGSGAGVTAGNKPGQP